MKSPATLASSPTDGLYRIATVSNLTGIPIPTIRVWESRYAVVQPTRNAGNARLYRRVDIERLSLVKAAVDSVGWVASSVRPLPHNWPRRTSRSSSSGSMAG